MTKRVTFKRQYCCKLVYYLRTYCSLYINITYMRQKLNREHNRRLQEALFCFLHINSSSRPKKKNSSSRHVIISGILVSWFYFSFPKPCPCGLFGWMAGQQFCWGFQGQLQWYVNVKFGTPNVIMHVQQSVSNWTSGTQVLCTLQWILLTWMTKITFVRWWFSLFFPKFNLGRIKVLHTFLSIDPTCESIS